MIAYGYLTKLRNGEETPENIARFNETKHDLGYGLLLKRYTDNVVDATEAQIQMAVKDSTPSVAPVFWAFRIMVGAGTLMLLLFGLAFYYNAKRQIVPALQQQNNNSTVST